ncbi:right-handed parallel beta-helix repeat-containing protein [Natrarchaeobius chitinivorans]|nr:right-handed parallel beta-helix repeat-containing protein [Natrarchaeobius chitinivorans]
MTETLGKSADAPALGNGLKRRSAVIIAVLVAVSMAAFVVATPVAATASEITVSDGESIQDAVDEAEPGDTIVVEDGNYEEEVIIDVEDISIVAADGASPVLDGGGDDGLETAISIEDANGVTIEGFNVSNYLEDTAIVVQDSAGVTLSDMDVIGGWGNSGDGIHLVNSPDAVVEDTVVDEHNYGVLVETSDGTLLENVTALENSDGVEISAENVVVTESTFETNGDAIRVRPGADGAVVENSTFYDNYGNAVYAYQAADLEVRNNTATDSRDEGFDIYQSPDAVVTENEVTSDYAEYGVLIRDNSHGAIVDGNDLSENDEEGILVEASNAVTIMDNVVEGNVPGVGSLDNGIQVRASEGTTIVGNEIHDNGYRGIYVNGRSIWGSTSGPNADVIVEDNNVSGHDAAVDVSFSANATITGNDLESGLVLDGDQLAHFDHPVEDNTVDGEPLFFANGEDDPAIPDDIGQIIVVNSTNVDVSGHEFTDVAAGIQIAYSDQVTVHDNDLTRGGHDDFLTDRGQINFWDGTDVTVTENTMQDSEWMGLVLYGTEEAVIDGNEIDAPTRYGLFAEGTVDVEITNNDVTNGVETDGINIGEDADDTTIADNVVTGNEEMSGIQVEDGDATITGNEVSNNARGIAIYEAGDVTISNNVVTDHHWVGIGPRHSTDTNERLVIESNEVARNGQGIGSGNADEDVTIRDNVISESEGNGIEARTGLITNNTVTDVEDNGIEARSGATVDDNTILNSGEHGIYAWGGDLMNNTVTDSGLEGIYIDGFEDDQVVNNSVSGHDIDLRLDESANATVVGNEFETGVFLDVFRDGVEFTDHAFEDNLVAGDPLVYFHDVDDPNVPTDAGQVIIANSSNVTAEDLTLDDSAPTIQVIYSENVTIADSTITAPTTDGLYLAESVNVTLDSVTVEGGDTGVATDELESIEVTNSVLVDNDDYGLAVDLRDGVQNATITDNTIARNGVGVDLNAWGDLDGIVVTGNAFQDNVEGLVLQDETEDVTIAQNSFEGNDFAFVNDYYLTADEMTVTDNWWGAESGASGGVTDACTGTVADGAGDAIDDDGDNNVCFDPWLNEDPIDGPSASFTVDPADPDEGEEITFDASGSTAPDGDVTAYHWDFNGDGEINETTADPETAHVFDTPGTYEVELTVEDENGVTATTNETVEVYGLDPLEAIFEWEPPAPEPSEDVTFDAENSTAPTGDVDTYHWDFGDGTTETTSSPEITHQYTEDGSYAVELEIETESGETNATTATIHVAVEGEAIWTETVDERFDDNAPTVVDGMAYISDFQGTVYAIDVDTGDVEWEFERDYDGTDEAPTVVDGVVYVAGGTSLIGDSGTLYAIDAETGDERWNETMTRPPRGSTVVGDTVYVSTGPDFDHNNGYVLAFDATDGEALWEYETTGQTRGAPTVADGTVFIGDRVGTVYALGAADGTEKWTFQSDSGTNIPTSPTVDDGTVYVPVDNVVPEFGGDVTRWTTEVHALDAETGAEIWDEPFGDDYEGAGITAAPTVHDGTIYVPGGDSELFAIDADDGSEAWRFDSSSMIRSSPTVVHAPDDVDKVHADDALVFVGTGDGTVYAIGDASSAVHWVYDAGDRADSSPTAADGVVYVAGNEPDFDGTLHAIDAGVGGSSSDSRIRLATFGHNEALYPQFLVEVTDSNAPVLEGETLEVEVTVHNVGGEGTQEVELVGLDGSVEDTVELTLERHETETVTLTNPTAEDDADYGDITVRTEDNADEKEIAIQQEVALDGCTDIDTPGVYTIVSGQTSSSTCITITSSYVELDGQGIYLAGGGGMDDGAHGIHVDGTDGQLTNVVINDVHLESWSSFQVDNAGIRVQNVTDSEITNSTSIDGYYGIWANDLTNSTIHGNDLSGNNWYGAYLYDSPGNVITDNEMTGAYYGLHLASGSDDAVVEDNVIVANNYGLLLTGVSGVEVADIDARYNRGDVQAPWDLPDFYASDSGPTVVENYTVSAPSEVTVNDVTGDSVDDGVVYASDEVEFEFTATPASEFIVSFGAQNVDLEATHAPAENPNAHSLGTYIDVQEESGTPSYLNLSVHYDEAHLDGADPTDLSLWRYDHADETWEELEDSSVDTDNEVVTTDLTEFGTIGLFVEEPGDAEPGVPATEEISDLTVIVHGDNAWQNLEESATHLSGTKWNATVDVDDLPSGDTYDLWMDLENEFDATYSINIDKDLEEVEVLGEKPDVSITAVDSHTADEGTMYASEDVTVTIEASADDGRDVDTVDLEIHSLATTWSHDVAASHDGGETWTATIDLEDVPDDAPYELSARATDEAGLDNETEVDETLVIDRESPSLTGAIEDVDGEAATIEIRSDTDLEGAPTASVTGPDGSTTEPTVQSDGDHWNATIDLDSAGEYDVTIEGTDLAGNDGTATTAVTADTEFATDNRTGVLHNEETGTFIEFETESDLQDGFAAVSENEDAYEKLEDDLLGAGFLTAMLGDDLEANLTSATIHVPADVSDVDGVDDPEAVDITHYNGSTDEWETVETTVETIADDTIGVNGEYWVAEVEEFSTYGAIATDDEPPELLATTPDDGETLEHGSDDVTLEFEYDDDGSGVDVGAVELVVDGSDVSDDPATAITSTSASHEMDVVDGESYTAAVTLADEAGNVETYDLTFAVDDGSTGDDSGSGVPDENGDDDGDTEDGGTGGSDTDTSPGDTDSDDDPDSDDGSDADDDPDADGDDSDADADDSDSDTGDSDSDSDPADGDTDGSETGTDDSDPDASATGTDDSGEDDTVPGFTGVSGLLALLLATSLLWYSRTDR